MSCRHRVDSLNNQPEFESAAVFCVALFTCFAFLVFAIITPPVYCKLAGSCVCRHFCKVAATSETSRLMKPFLNDVCQVAETIGTFSLIWFALMLEERVNFLDTPDTADNLMPILGPLLIGFLVSMCRWCSTPITAITCSFRALLMPSATSFVLRSTICFPFFCFISYFGLSTTIEGVGRRKTEPTEY